MESAGDGKGTDNDNGDIDANKDKATTSTPTAATTVAPTSTTTTTSGPTPSTSTPAATAVAVGARNVGILRVDTAGARRVVQPSEPSSPQPSVDRLSVSFALGHADYDGRSLSDTEHQQSKQQQGQPQEVVGVPSGLNAGAGERGRGSKSNLFSMAESEGAGPAAAGGAVGGSGNGPAGQLLSAALTDEDDDYSASISAILHRRASTRKVKGLGRRTSSPLDSDNRRCSVFTTSSGETAITMDGGEGGPVTQEQIFENIRLHKEVLDSVRNQPWDMRRKLKLVQQAKEYVRLHEGQLQERLAQSKTTRDIMARFNLVMSRWWQHMKRAIGNWAVTLTPWELRIKEIESHFGSVVASYFTFLRWIFWINIVITAIIICLVIVPEVFASDPALAGDRKVLLESEKRTGSHLETIWNFEGVMKHSPLFYGYYSDQPKTKEGYPLPLSYFLTGLGVYAYSFVAILRRMAKNSRQSKLSEKEDECIFSWKLFTGWDYMIGNPETAFNRFASITMGFKEALLEEKEKKKDERNWKTIGLRVLANFLVLLLLMSSGFAIVFVVGRSEQLETSGEAQTASWWRKNEITLVLSLITTVFPNIFEIIGMLEGYHPRKQLRFQLARIMVLNFLNLYTLIIALFGQVQTMTSELERLRPTTTMAGPTFAPDYNYCVNVSVNCTVLQEFEFYQKEKHAKDVLTLIVKSVIYSKYEPELLGIPGNRTTENKTSTVTTSLTSTADIIPLILKQSANETNPDYATLLAKAVVELMYSATPQMGTISEDLRQYFSDVNDHENLTIASPFLNAVSATNLIPENATVLKTSLPILFEIIHKYIPSDRVFKMYDKISTTESYDNVTDTTDMLSCNITSMCSDDEMSSTGSSVSTFSTTTDMELSTTSLPDAITTSSTPGPLQGVLNGAGAGRGTSSRPRRPEWARTTPVAPYTATTTPTTTSRLSYRRRKKPTTTKSPVTAPAYPGYRDSIWGRQRRSKTVAYTITKFGGSTSPESDDDGTEVTEADESRYNNLQLTGENSYQSVPVDGKSSTRGDIPGDLSQSDDELTSTTTAMSSTTELLVLPDDFTDKLITTIKTIIQIISTQNSSRTDYSNLTTVDQFVNLVATFHTHSETRLTNDPYNSSLSATFDRNTTMNETNKCFIMACENGTTFPADIYEYLNCSDLICAMDALLIIEPTRPSSAVRTTSSNAIAARGNGSWTNPVLNSLPPGCVIPGSRSCITTEAPTTRDPDIAIKLRRLCWETMFGQELVKLTVMDLIFTVGFILAMDFIRAILVRVLNPCWCWDLEKRFPQYGDFKIAENILHLVNNQGMVWMGMFFSPGLPALNLIKLVILMYIRSWAVMTCNVPHETVFRASRSNNFYFALLLFMLFLCTLPVGFAIVWLKPSWHCGPFSKEYDKIYYIFTVHLKELVPVTFHDVLDYIASPAVIIPLLVLLVLIIYYLTSLTNSLRESNNDLKIQLRRERTEERRKMFRIAGGKGKEKESPFTRWRNLIPAFAPVVKGEKQSILTTGKQTGFAGLAKRATLKAREEVQKQQSEPVSLQDDGTDIDQASLPDDIVALPQTSKLQKKVPPPVAARKTSRTDSVASIRSEIPVIKIEDTNKGDDKGQPVGIVTTTAATTAAATASTTPILKPALAQRPPSPTAGKNVIPTQSGISVAPAPTAEAVTPSRKQRVLKALISKAKDTKEIRSPPVEKSDQDEPIIPVAVAVDGKVKFFNTAESLEERQLLSVATAQSVDEEDVSILKMEEQQTDVHPFFIKIQSMDKQE